MKKLLFLLIGMLVASIMSAQENESKFIDMNRDFKVSGECAFFCKTESPNPSDACDLIWELSNQRIGEDNFVILIVKDKNDKIIESVTWKENIDVFLLKTGEKRNYIVNDDTFSHLRIIEQDKGKYAVHLYSDLLKK